ncbi:MAG: phage Gp37/Gp68 family protein [Gammaproteobacteria bacterium]|nr:phage Gp37/Gp68 family protein [Gammaproteobacteria bacterium]
MTQGSSIEWTDATWNPVTGCTKLSQGCKNCYAHRMAKRLHAMGQPRYRNNFEVTVHHDLITQPLKWSRPRRVFVNSMSDLFHPDVDLQFIQAVFDVMGEASQHNFQILTKRSDRLLELGSILQWHKNIWMGVSVESQEYVNRIRHLQRVPAAVRFLSVEPLLGPISRLPLTGIDWVIVGGESGPKCRLMDLQWVRQIRDRCIAFDVPFFFKQWGGTRKKSTGRTLDGRTWDQMPEPNVKRFRRVAI